MENYRVIRKVGQGAQGTVFRAVEIASDRTVALKVIDVGSMDENARKAALSEVRVLAALQDDPHPCVMGYHASFIHDDQLYIALDWCEGGSLQDALQSIAALEGRRREDFLWTFVVSLLAALEHIHKRGILHRDVKLANVFLAESTDGQPRIKLGDFGVSCILSDRSRARTVVGTPYYLSPELCRGAPYGEKSDVWSFGVALYHLCHGKLPFEASNYAALIMQILSGKVETRVGLCPPALQALARSCMRKSEASRPTASQALTSREVQAAAGRLHLGSLAAALRTDADVPSCAQEATRSALPLKRSTLAGAVPSRRVRNKHLQPSPQLAAPAAPVRLLSSAFGQRRRQPTVPPRVSTPDNVPGPTVGAKPSSEAANRRAAAAVAALPSFGSDSEDEQSQSGSRRDADARGPAEPLDGPDDAAGDLSDNTADDSGTDAVPVMTWRVDDESGTVENSRPDCQFSTSQHEPGSPQNAAAAGSPDPDIEAFNEEGDELPTVNGLSGVFVEQSSLLADVQDEAEHLVEPSRFVELVDALRHTPQDFEALVAAAVAPNLREELTYLCYRYVFLG